MERIAFVVRIGALGLGGNEISQVHLQREILPVMTGLSLYQSGSHVV